MAVLFQLLPAIAKVEGHVFNEKLGGHKFQAIVLVMCQYFSSSGRFVPEALRADSSGDGSVVHAATNQTLQAVPSNSFSFRFH